MTAALNGKVDAIKMLLTHGAKVNATEPYKGQTALMWAAGEGNADAAAMLIEFGGDVKAKSKAGFTPLLFAVHEQSDSPPPRFCWNTARTSRTDRSTAAPR